MLKSPIFTVIVLTGLAFAAVVVIARSQTAARVPPRVALAEPVPLNAAPIARGAFVPGVQATQILEAAIGHFENFASVAAAINLEINLLGYDLIGSGIYLEQDPLHSHHVRLELNVHRGDQTFTMLQVCDGRYLWNYRDRGTGPEVTRINLEKISRAREQRDGQPFWPGDLTGMATYLRRLRDGFDFGPVEDFRSPQGLSLWRIRGRWKPYCLAVMLPEQKKAIEQGRPADLSKLPAYAPDEVVVCLRQSDLFPSTFEYRRTSADQDGNPKTAVITAMWLTNIRVNIPIEPVRFHYSPGDLKPMDQTQWYMHNIYGVAEAK
jgi:hypothetical protein